MGRRGVEGAGGVVAVMDEATEAAGRLGDQGNTLRQDAVLWLDLGEALL